MTSVSAQNAAVNDLSAFGKARSTVKDAPLSAEEVRKTDAFWKACNYLALGMIYLRDNPLQGAVKARTHQEPPARPLGCQSGAVVCLHPPEPGHQGAGPRHDLHGRARGMAKPFDVSRLFALQQEAPANA